VLLAFLSKAIKSRTVPFVYSSSISSSPMFYAAASWFIATLWELYVNTTL